MSEEGKAVLQWLLIAFAVAMMLITLFGR